MKSLFIVNDPPYGTERVYNALRLAHALIKRDASMQVTVFLMAALGRMISENDGIQCPMPLSILSRQWPDRPDQTAQITSLLARRPLCADSVAKPSKCRAINFPRMDQTSRNRLPMWLPGRYRSRL
jgi:hypothetical protein